MKLADWSNTVINAFKREWDISMRGEFKALARLDLDNPSQAVIEVSHYRRGRRMTLQAQKIRSDAWVIRDANDELVSVLTPGDEWPWRLRLAAIMLWLQRNEEGRMQC